MSAVELTDQQINAMRRYAEDTFAEWEARASEGHCIRKTCIGRLRELREDELAYLGAHCSSAIRVIGRCVECGSFVHRRVATGFVSGEFWSIYAPELERA